jgi:hypothetical protein
MRKKNIYLCEKTHPVFSLMTHFGISTQCFQFDWLLESVTRFLEFRDVGNVSKVNCFYYSKTWRYFLGSVNRCRTEQPIPLCSKSIKWIKKYRLFIGQEKLELDSNSPDFDLSVIPKLFTLILSSIPTDDIPTTFPLQVNYLSCEAIIGDIPNFVATHVLLFRSSITAYSETVETLLIQKDCVYCHGLPNFPNLKKLELHANYLFNMGGQWDSKGLLWNDVGILTKYPNLEYLKISCRNIDFVDAIQNYKHKLVIASFDLVDITCFSMLQCSELDLSGCPKIQDYSGVAHIPIVRKYEKIK